MLRLRRLSSGSAAFFFVAGCCAVSNIAASAEDRAAGMQEARWGVMNHYLADWIARGER